MFSSFRRISIFLETENGTRMTKLFRVSSLNVGSYKGRICVSFGFLVTLRLILQCTHCKNPSIDSCLLNPAARLVAYINVGICFCYAPAFVIDMTISDTLLKISDGDAMAPSLQMAYKVSHCAFEQIAH